MEAMLAAAGPAIVKSCLDYAASVCNLDGFYYNRDMCHRLKAIVASLQQVLHSAEKLASHSTTSEPLAKLLTSLQAAERFVSDSQRVSMLEMIFKKTEYKRRCQDLMYDLNMAKESLQFAITVTLYKQLDNPQIPVARSKRSLRKEVEEAVNYDYTRDLQSSIAYVKKNPNKEGYGQQTKNVANKVQDIKAIDDMMKAIAELPAPTGPNYVEEWSQAAEHYENKRYREALNLYLNLTSYYPEAHFRIGRIYDRDEKSNSQMSQQSQSSTISSLNPSAVERNPGKAAMHYFQAYRAGCDLGLGYLGALLFRGGPDFAPNPEYARRILDIGMNSDDPAVRDICNKTMSKLLKRTSHTGHCPEDIFDAFVQLASIAVLTIESLEFVVKGCESIARFIAKGNKDMCEKLANEVDSIVRLLHEDKKHLSSPGVSKAIKKLRESLEKAKKFVDESKHPSMLELIFKKNQYMRRCKNLMKELNDTKENFVAMLNMKLGRQPQVLTTKSIKNRRKEIDEIVRSTYECDLQSSARYVTMHQQERGYGEKTQKVAESKQDIKSMDDLIKVIGELEVASEPDPEEQWKKAMSLYYSGDHKSALDPFVQLTNTYAEAYYRIGLIYEGVPITVIREPNVEIGHRILGIGIKSTEHEIQKRCNAVMNEYPKRTSIKSDSKSSLVSLCLAEQQDANQFQENTRILQSQDVTIQMN
ncbi:hypothetical protein EDD86DRAFT_248254 [Gorgonomyces haynaldii]|nr:hypothetical protein EDD86DRAFT_248254 [Gorgonomyces haynaldii]